MKPSSLLILLITLLSFSFMGCDEDGNLTVTIPIPEKSFNLSAKPICEALKGQLQSELRQLDCDRNTNTGQRTSRDITLNIETRDLATDVDISEQIKSNETLNKYKDSIVAVYLSKVEYWAEPNTLNLNTIPVEIYIGPPQAKTINDNGVIGQPFLTLGVIKQGDSGHKQTVTNREVAKQATKFFKTGKFALIPKFNPVLPQGSPIPPQGEANIHIKADLTITVDPVQVAKTTIGQ